MPPAVPIGQTPPATLPPPAPHLHPSAAARHSTRDSGGGGPVPQTPPPSVPRRSSAIVKHRPAWVCTYYNPPPRTIGQKTFSHQSALWRSSSPPTFRRLSFRISRLFRG